jgi:UDP-2-acetamido-3-amino-2,3-dideoxy-glucuronate N-acetyltransferase
MSQGYFAHPSAIIDTPCTIGAGTKIWHFCHISQGARIGERCSFGQNVYVAGTVVIGNNVKVQNNVSIYDGVILEDEVFCGPSMVFTNVLNPRSAVVRKAEYRSTLVKRGATIGANATVICGTIIGEYAFIGAGAVVTRDVPAFALVLGVPGRVVGWMSAHGERLPPFDAEGQAVCPATGEVYQRTPDGVRRLGLSAGSRVFSPEHRA